MAYWCKDCHHSFETIDYPEDYDPIYCPYCGHEAITDEEAVF